MTYETHELVRVLRLTKDKARKSPEKRAGSSDQRMHGSEEKMHPEIGNSRAGIRRLLKQNERAFVSKVGAFGGPSRPTALVKFNHDG